MGDVLSALETLDSLGSGTIKTLQSLRIKEELLILLLNDEQTRLNVWLAPLDHETKRLFVLGPTTNSINDVSLFYGNGQNMN